MSATVRILVFGGAAFVGRAIVEDALHSGAEVTLFARGRTGPDAKASPRRAPLRPWRAPGRSAARPPCLPR